MKNYLALITVLTMTGYSYAGGYAIKYAAPSCAPYQVASAVVSYAAPTYYATYGVIPAVFVPPPSYTVGAEKPSTLAQQPGVKSVQSPTPTVNTPSNTPDDDIRSLLVRMNARMDQIEARLEGKEIPPKALLPKPKENDPATRFRGLLERGQCMKCHGGTNKKGGLSLEGQWSSELTENVVEHVFVLGDMPPPNVKSQWTKQDRTELWKILTKPNDTAKAAPDRAPVPAEAKKEDE